ncbi:MAG: hypothetical protein KBT13_07815 [Bacteroidales bacterium]|nr:hypothetical protein [Candidatus Sodaliphilus limicaballi]
MLSNIALCRFLYNRLCSSHYILGYILLDIQKDRNLRKDLRTYQNIPSHKHLHTLDHNQWHKLLSNYRSNLPYNRFHSYLCTPYNYLYNHLYKMLYTSHNKSHYMIAVLLAMRHY